MILFDSDVLINHQRGVVEASIWIETCLDRAISAVTYMEFIQKCPNRRVYEACRNLIKEMDFTIIPVNENISSRAINIIEDYSLSSHIGIIDAIIAATALDGDLTLLTYNHKHYKPIKNIKLKRA
jgi:hypothetical protein